MEIIKKNANKKQRDPEVFLKKYNKSRAIFFDDVGDHLLEEFLSTPNIIHAMSTGRVDDFFIWHLAQCIDKIEQEEERQSMYSTVLTNAPNPDQSWRLWFDMRSLGRDMPPPEVARPDYDGPLEDFDFDCSNNNKLPSGYTMALKVWPPTIDLEFEADLPCAAGWTTERIRIVKSDNCWRAPSEACCFDLVVKRSDGRNRFFNGNDSAFVCDETENDVAFILLFKYVFLRSQPLTVNISDRVEAVSRLSPFQNDKDLYFWSCTSDGICYTPDLTLKNRLVSLINK
jgi:hypothetical protein